jgi:hypothetical protein
MIEAFAPTSRAAQTLSGAGMKTSTLQHHLVRGEQPDTGEKRLFVLDESSLTSTRQMQEFVMHLHRNDRVLLVGDTASMKLWKQAGPSRSFRKRECVRRSWMR